MHIENLRTRLDATRAEIQSRLPELDISAIEDVLRLFGKLEAIPEAEDLAADLSGEGFTEPATLANR